MEEAAATVSPSDRPPLLEPPTCPSSPSQPSPWTLPDVLEGAQTATAKSKRRKKGRDMVRAEWGEESKSGEVCGPLVCNFQNDSRTGAEVRGSEALSTSASCGGAAGRLPV